MSSSHNERIAAKREKACLEFMETTSTNMTTAKHYLQQAAFDLERAVGLFYDAGGESLPDNNEQQPQGADATSQEEEDTTAESAASDPISAIMDSATKEDTTSSKKESSSSSSSFAFRGKGHSLNSSNNPTSSENNNNNNNNNVAVDDEPQPLKVIVAFYKDGFTAAVKQEPQPEQKDNRDRRRGVHSISSSSSSSSTPEDEMRLPPLRDYDTPENKIFLQDVQESRVPKEFRTYDTQRRPIPVSIYLQDHRPRPYPQKVWEQQLQRDKELQAKSSFGGTGQTLGGSAAVQQETTSTAPVNPNGNNIFFVFFQWLLVWWRFFLDGLVRFFRSTAATMAPPKKHIVDVEKPVTTLSLRMPGNTREQVKFNTDHTVQDLVQYCQIILSENTSDNNNNKMFLPDDFQLVSGFPPRPIDTSNNNQESLKEASLLNAAVEIRMVVPTEGKEKRN